MLCDRPFVPGPWPLSTVRSDLPLDAPGNARFLRHVADTLQTPPLPDTMVCKRARKNAYSEWTTLETLRAAQARRHAWAAMRAGTFEPTWRPWIRAFRACGWLLLALAGALLGAFAWAWIRARSAVGLRMTAHRIEVDGHRIEAAHVASIALVEDRVTVLLHSGRTVRTRRLALEDCAEADAWCQWFVPPLDAGPADDGERARLDRLTSGRVGRPPPVDAPR